jgi:bacterioferritin
MRGDQRLIDGLNGLLAGELTAISQYIVHGEMCDDWGYAKLHHHLEKRAIEEMKHAEKLIGRILFLEGTPIMTEPIRVVIGSEIYQQVLNDRDAETNTIRAYNEMIALAAEVNDHATRDMLVEILRDEDRHMDEIEVLQGQIDQMGLPVFLTTQV